MLVKKTENRVKMKLQTALLQKGLMFMNRATEKGTTGTKGNQSQNRRERSIRVIANKQTTMVHSSYMDATRGELGPLNLDYADMDRKMLKQAIRLKKRLG